MPSIEFIGGEIDRMRKRVNRQRTEIRQLRQAGISTTSAAARKLDRMVHDLRAERDRLRREQFRAPGQQILRRNDAIDNWPILRRTFRGPAR